jgi:hypothetical protein
MNTIKRLSHFATHNLTSCLVQCTFSSISAVTHPFFLPNPYVRLLQHNQAWLYALFLLENLGYLPEAL